MLRYVFPVLCNGSSVLTVFITKDRTESIYFRYLERGEIPESEDEDSGDYEDEGISSGTSEDEEKPAKGKGKPKARKAPEDEEVSPRKPRIARITSSGKQ